MRLLRSRRPTLLLGLLLSGVLLTACGVADATPPPGPDTIDAPRAAIGEVRGEILYVDGGDIYRWSADDGSKRIIDVDGDNGGGESPVWSPDGQRFAWVRTSIEGYSDLLLANRDGSTMQVVTANRPDEAPYSRRFAHFAYWAMDPTWSPVDPEQIVYVSDRGGVEFEYSDDPTIPGRLSDPMFLWIRERAEVEPYILNAAFDLGLAQENPSFDPTGSAVGFTVRANASTTQVWTLDLNTAEATVLVEANAYDPAWSPDGNAIAYIQRNGQANDLWIVPRLADGSWGAPYALTSGCACVAPEWSPDGDALAFVELVDAEFRIAHLSLTRAADGRLSAGERSVLIEGERIDAPSGLSWWAP